MDEDRCPDIAQGSIPNDETRPISGAETSFRSGRLIGPHQRLGMSYKARRYRVGHVGTELRCMSTPERVVPYHYTLDGHKLPADLGFKHIDIREGEWCWFPTTLLASIAFHPSGGFSFSRI